MLKQALLLLSLILPIHIIFSQSVRDIYDLGFEKTQKDMIRWSWLVNAKLISFTIDSTAVNGKYPLKIFSQRRAKDPHNACFKLMRTIPLPEKLNNEICTVTIRCKNKNLKALKFQVTYIDKNEENLFSDSIFINKTSWEDYSISFAKKGIKAVRIGLSSEDEDLQEPQTAWVDIISIHIGDKTINDNAIEDLYPKNLSELEKKYIIPLSPQNDDNIQKIFSTNADRKIIGLGESTHGSHELKEMNYQFMKTLITQFGYKTILMERKIDLTLNCDLYIRGLISEAFENQIIDECRCYFDDYLLFFNFLKWAREYNKTSETKIRIFGFDGFLDKQTCLFEYFQMILDKENPNLPYYLKKIGDGQFQEIKNMATNDTLLKSKLGHADFNYLIFLLEKDGMTMERKLLHNNKSYNRDKDMWSIVEKVINTYASGNEKVIVHSHSDHLNKYTSFLSVDLIAPPLGSYIANKYKEDYFAISYQIAEGTYTQDETGIVGNTMIHELQKAPKNSFEYRGLNTGLDYFYYPTNQLTKYITHLRILLRTGRYLDQFYFCSIKKRFDGLVFIKNSSNLKNIESYLFFNVNGMMQLKRRIMNEGLKKLENKVYDQN